MARLQENSQHTNKQQEAARRAHKSFIDSIIITTTN